jgi:hypothetical protein
LKTITMKSIKDTAQKLSEGIRVEREHRKLYEFIQENGLPDPDTFFKMIALDHLAEDPNYYKKLEKIENGRSNDF